MENELVVTPKKIDLTPELVKNKIAIELAKNELAIQVLNDLEGKLVYNDDNLQNISDFRAKLKKAKKLVEDQREEQKKPILADGKNVDAGAKLLASELDRLDKKSGDSYTKLCQTIEARRLKEQQEKELKAKQKATVDHTIMRFSEKISSLLTVVEVNDIERLFNLELANVSKYGDSLQELKNRAQVIRTLIADRKGAIKEISNLEEKGNHAAENGQFEEVEKIFEQKEQREAFLKDNEIRILEQASQTTVSDTIEGETQYPVIKPKRTTDEFEVVDKNLAFKKKPEFFEIVENKEEIKKELKRLRSSGEWKEDQTELIVNGIKYFQKKTY